MASLRGPIDYQPPAEPITEFVDALRKLAQLPAEGADDPFARFAGDYLALQRRVQTLERQIHHETNDGVVGLDQAF